MISSQLRGRSNGEAWPRRWSQEARISGGTAPMPHSGSRCRAAASVTAVKMLVAGLCERQSVALREQQRRGAAAPARR